MARYLGCGICMKVCPIQKYGMKNVMEHYAETGQVLGKGTHDLEGYSSRARATSAPVNCRPSTVTSSRCPTATTSSDHAFDNFREQGRRPRAALITDELI